MDIHSAIKVIQEIPEAQVDRNFGQGDSVLGAQVEALYADIAPASKDEIIHSCQLELSQLIQMVAPYSLPEDYLCFLKFYGGLSIGRVATDSPLLTIFGTGPAINLFYPSVVEINEDVVSVINQLHIASIDLPRYTVDQNSLTESREGVSRHSFDEALDLCPSNLDRRIYLDLAGPVQKYTILTTEIDPKSFEILRWIKIANTFSDWLELIAKDGGRFQRLIDSIHD